MKHFVCHLSCVVLMMPAVLWADDTATVAPDPLTDAPFRQGLDVLRDGAELLMQDLFDEIEPALKGLEHFALELEAYDAPVVLPNGDILIRRKTPVDQNETPDHPKVPLPREHIEIDPMQDDDIEL
jgi:hypothetical protein